MLLHQRYDVGEVLGEGAFGRTVAARDGATGADVVLKLITIRGLPGWKELEHFEREVAVLRSLNHPGVPRFVDSFQAEIDGSGPVMALVMERIRGESLLALIQRGHRWEEAHARALLESLLGTLDYLHGLSPLVIHRDIKPG
jgi:serine/threonine protein kinase